MSRVYKSEGLSWWILFLLSFAIIFFAFVIDQTLRWTEHYDGFINGLLHGSLCGIAGCIIYILPWSLLVCWGYRKKDWSENRSFIFLAPSLLILLLILGGLIISPPTAKERFKEDFKIEMPREISALRYKLSGGGIADRIDTFYFRTTPKEIENMIAKMGLAEDASYAKPQVSVISQIPEIPDPSSWKAARSYSWDNESYFITLIVNDSKTEVYFRMLQI